jgi:hypothetical protein
LQIVMLGVGAFPLWTALQKVGRRLAAYLLASRLHVNCRRTQGSCRASSAPEELAYRIVVHLEDVHTDRPTNFCFGFRRQREEPLRAKPKNNDATTGMI